MALINIKVLITVGVIVWSLNHAFSLCYASENDGEKEIDTPYIVRKPNYNLLLLRHYRPLGEKEAEKGLNLLQELTELRILGCSIPKKGSEYFSQFFKETSTLEKLIFFDSHLEDRYFFKCLSANSSITTLNLYSTTLSDRKRAQEKVNPFKSLRENSTLTELTLTNFLFFKKNPIQFLLGPLEYTSTLTKLSLYNNQLNKENIKSISIFLTRNSTLTDLDLRGNPLGFQEGVKELAHSLSRNTTLRNLDVRENLLGIQGIQNLLKYLMGNTGLTKLDISKNSIGDAGAKSLSDVLRVNSTLTEVRITRNEIGPIGALYLSTVFKINPSLLSVLDLSFNRLGDKGAQYIFESLRANTKLSKMQIAGNKIGPIGARCLSMALETNFSPTMLDLSFNHLGDKGAQYIFESLRKKTDLTSLSLILEKNYIDEKRKQIFRENLNVGLLNIYELKL